MEGRDGSVGGTNPCRERTSLLEGGRDKGMLV